MHYFGKDKFQFIGLRPEWTMDNGQWTIKVFFFEKRINILEYIAEGNTFIVNYQLSIVNFYRANGAINWNLHSRNDTERAQGSNDLLRTGHALAASPAGR